jgi:SAM-dependent methyltransferase
MAKETRCRSCKSESLIKFLDLGETPLADRILKPEQLDEEEPVFPLEVAYCGSCHLVQITETVDPELLFASDYPYFSSFSPAWLEHCRQNVLEAIDEKKLDDGSLVVEIASNDGYLLKNYLEKGIPVLGIDPARPCVEAAEKIGVPSMCEFFTEQLAKSLAAEGKRADVIHANNVLAHVADTNGIVKGMKAMLKADGVAIIEAPYLRDLIDHVEFDTIYHEHLCYFSVTALKNLFEQNDLFLNDVKRISTHGGSLRMFVQTINAPTERLKKILKEEHELGMDSFEYYRDFAVRVDALKSKLLPLLRNLKAEGKSLAAYGAAAKGATMVNFVGINHDELDFVVDRNVHKQGRYMPGCKIPIVAPEKLVEEQPDYVLVLAWNFFEEIVRQQKEYSDRGGKFIVPVPEPRII